MVSADQRQLKPDVISTLGLDDNPRIAFIDEDRWIGYPAATEIGKSLDELVTSKRVTRPPGIALVGRPNNGKTTLARRLIQKHPPQINEDGVYAPVVFCHMPGSADEATFWSGLLTQLQIAHRTNAPPRTLANQASRVLIEMSTKVLIVDEFHHLANSSAREQSKLSGSLKNLSSTNLINLVFVGTQALIGALRADEQLATRLKPHVLERWNASGDYLKLLALFERHLPLRKPSNLHSKELALEIFHRSNQTIGGTKEVINFAAKLAILSGEEKITLDIVRAAPSTSHDELNRLMRKA